MFNFKVTEESLKRLAEIASEAAEENYSSIEYSLQFKYDSEDVKEEVIVHLKGPRGHCGSAHYQIPVSPDLTLAAQDEENAVDIIKTDILIGVLRLHEITSP